MATIYANDGDTVIIARRHYTLDIQSEGPELRRANGMCEACAQNDASDYEFGGHEICPTCIRRAMHATVIHSALNHLMQHDDELRETLLIMGDIDAHAQRQGVVQHVDFHSASWDDAWTWDDDERREILANFMGAIEAVIASRTLVART